MTVGERIKSAREAAGLTQEQLGQKIDVTGVAIMRYEKDQREPRRKQLERIADALGVDVNWIMTGYTVKDFDSAMKSWVDQRYEEAQLDKRLQDSYPTLNINARRRIVEISEDLAKLPEHRRKEMPDVIKRTKIKVYGDGPAGSFPPAPQSPSEPTEGKDATPPPDGAEGPPEGK